MPLYNAINYFFLFSFLGYLLECAVLSYENRKLVLNRGFGHGPFCIIYGFGAIGAIVLLSPVADHSLRLYLASMTMATLMELVTARLMIRLFGTFWWDYSRKRFNYKGIVCLESSLAWGFLGILYFRFLDGFANQMVAYIPVRFGRFLAVSLLLFYAADFLYTVRIQRKQLKDEDETPITGRLKVY